MYSIHTNYSNNENAYNKPFLPAERMIYLYLSRKNRGAAPDAFS
jgi:hypothetical protein